MLTLAQTAALIAGAAIYVVGFIGLLWAIYRTITGEVNAALHAVSLIPRTVVAGQGVRIFFGFPLLIVVVVPVFAFVQRLLRNLILTIFPTASEVIFYVADRPQSVAVMVSSLMVFGLFVWVLLTNRYIYLITGMFSRDWVFPEFRWATVLWWGVFVALCLYAGRFVRQAFEPDTGGIVPGISDLGAISKGLVITFVAAFILGLVEAFSVSPRVQLPAVRITGPATTRGRLLAHSDGYWHLFDDKGVLVAIADDQAPTVRVSLAPEKGVWIATKFFREPSKQKDYP